LLIIHRIDKNGPKVEPEKAGNGCPKEPDISGDGKRETVNITDDRMTEEIEMSIDSRLSIMSISQVVLIRSTAEKAGEPDEAHLSNVVQIMRGQLLSTSWTGFLSNKVS
jgi:hypothetical protein